MMKSENTFINDSASFRDNAGVVFRDENGTVFRRINAVYEEKYRRLMSSGLYDELLNKHLLIPHKEIDGERPLIIRPKKIPYISYPYEWCFEQYRDAALATLDIHITALSYGMMLKDASAYNIQWLNGWAVLIDTLSFEVYEEGQPWVAYGQFCRHFVCPLLLMSKVDERLGKLMNSFIDGIPLDLASAILSGRGGVFGKLHIDIHGKSIEKHSTDRTQKQVYMKKSAFLALAKSLKEGILALKPPSKLTEWGEYYSHTNYSADSAKHKSDIVARFLDGIENLKQVWDFGANDGRYSRIAAKTAHVTAFDIDTNAVGRNYLEIRKSHEPILPLILDLTAPSPAIGFGNTERNTIGGRVNRPGKAPADCILMLAVIHHLAVSNNLPFELIARWVSELTEYLVIEFVPKSDSQVQILLSTRDDIFTEYDETHFTESFGRYFDICAREAIPDSERIMFLMKRKRN
ncbi:MAG: hypothetical protein LBM87_06160 [Ruminococcus sp.]|jgi:hypothetical protein|nr:hypothetical protein [Ruminococcus sp.]